MITSRDIWNFLHLPQGTNSKLFINYNGKNINISKYIGQNKIPPIDGIDENINLDTYIPCLEDKTIILYPSVKKAEEDGFFENNQLGYFTKNKEIKKGIFQPFEYNPKHTNFTDLDLGKTSPTFLMTNGLKYTFGVEIETVMGKLPYWVYYNNKLSLKCERDGSLKDPVTGKETGKLK